MNIQYSEAISVDHCSCYLIQISHYSSSGGTVFNQWCVGPYGDAQWRDRIQPVVGPYGDAQWRDRIQPEKMRLDRCIRTGHVVQSPGLLFVHHGLQIHVVNVIGRH